MMYNKLNLRQTWLLSLLLLGFGLTSSYAQVNTNYTFATTSPPSYVGIVGGTVLGDNTNDDETFPATGAPFAIPFAFNFNGTVMTGFGVDTNGWISLTAGATVPTLGSQTPISSAVGATNVISAFAFDLVATATGKISYLTVGSAPNRVLVVQWENYAQYENGPTPAAGPNVGDNFNFQIRLNETTNTIQVVYGAFARTQLATVPATVPLAGTVQVGLKGANTATDFNNRAVAATSTWPANIAGTVNTANCLVTPTVKPNIGLTFTWTPTFCLTPPAINTPTSWAAGTTGVLYNSGTITGTNLTGAVYSIVPAASTLPAGLTFLNGVVSGIPTVATVAAGVVYTVTATTTTVPPICSVSKPYTLIINAPVVCPPPTSVTFTPAGASLPSGSVGTPYNQTISQTGLTGATFTVAPPLPAGLSLSSAGAITGSPATVTASATYTVTATSGTCTATKTYTLDVVASCPAGVFTPAIATLIDATVGSVYSQTLSVAGFTNATFTVLPALPAGLSLSSAGVLSGTPTAVAANAAYVVTATAGVCTSVKTYVLAVGANQITAIDSNLSNLVKVSPNPSKGTFNVDFGRLVLNKTTLNVYDLRGKNVYTTKVTNNDMTISLNALANGVYLLEVISEQGRILKRLVKE